MPLTVVGPADVSWETTWRGLFCGVSRTFCSGNVRKGDRNPGAFVRFESGSIRVFACASTATTEGIVSSEDDAS
jgi:hypothetical protein